jgi:hypothetical protein
MFFMHTRNEVTRALGLSAGLQTLDLARKKGLCVERAAATDRLLEASAI